MGPQSNPRKPLVGRLGELILLYFLVGGLALLLERRAGQIASQGWEFYAITGTLFLTLAFQVLFTATCCAATADGRRAQGFP